MKQTEYREPLFLFLFAVLITTLFSTCSFLYPLNPWDDANVYMTIGNAMLSGRELYVDIFDHKDGTVPSSGSNRSVCMAVVLFYSKER